MRIHNYRIPFVRMLEDGRWEVLCRGLKGKRIYVGRFMDRVSAFIEFNRVMNQIWGEGGLLRLEKGLRMRLKSLDRNRGIKDKNVFVNIEKAEKDVTRETLNDTIKNKRPDDKLLNDLFNLLGE